MAKTNSGLVAYCRAQLGRPYWFGTFGQTASASLYNSKKNQYPEYYTANDFKDQYGQRVHDCAGLVKGYLWSDTPESNPKYDAKQDYGATAFYDNAKEKGKIETFPNRLGTIVFKGNDKIKTHMGVFVGGDEIIEAKGHKYGVVSSSLSKGNWKYWAQSDLIENDIESNQPEPIPAPVPTPTPSPTPNPDPPSLAGDYRMVKVNTSLRIRSGPGTQYEVIGKLANGALIKALDTQGRWVKIDKGWVSSGYLVTVIVKNYFVRVNSYLTVRSGPGTGYKAVGKLYNDNAVTVYNRQGTWGQIGVKRWVSMNYLE